MNRDEKRFLGLMAAIACAFLVASAVALGAGPSPPTLWAPTPATPLISASGPPISAGPVTVLNGHLAVAGQRWECPAVNWDNWTITGLVAFKNGQEVGLDPTYQGYVQQHLNRLAMQGFRAIRAHGLDSFSGGNLYGAATGKYTTQFDPIAMQALAYWMDQCKQRSIRVCLTVHFNRLLTPADVAVIQGTAANPPPEISELMTHGCGTLPPGGLWPWVAYFPSVQQLDAQYETQLFSYISPYDGLPLGRNPALFMLVVRNEQLLAGENVAWSYPNLPVLNAAFNAQFTAWCTANNVNIARAGALERAQFAASLDVQLAAIECAHLRSLCPGVLLASNTCFGNTSYAGLAGCQVGDLSDSHVYSRGAAGQPNAFLTITYPALRTPFAAYIAGCSKPGMPQTLTEWAGVGQYNRGVLDPPAEQAQLYGAMVTQAIAQDLDATFLYSDCSSVIQGEGSPFWTPSVYDNRINAPLMAGVQYWNAQFCKPRPAGPPTVTVKPTAGMFGSNAPGTYNYSIYGPANDAALLAIGAQNKVMLAP